MSHHAGTELVDRARLLGNRPAPRAGSTSGSCQCPRPGKSCTIHPPRPKTHRTTPTTTSARLVASPAPRRVIPRARTIGHAVGRGVSRPSKTAGPGESGELSMGLVMFDDPGMCPQCGEPALPIPARSASEGMSALPIPARSASEGMSALPIPARSASEGMSALPIPAQSASTGMSPHTSPRRQRGNVRPFSLARAGGLAFRAHNE